MYVVQVRIKLYPFFSLSLVFFTNVQQKKFAHLGTSCLSLFSKYFCYFIQV